MTSRLPLVHQARHSIRNRRAGNPFATDEVIADLIETLSTAYVAAANQQVRKRSGASWTSLRR